MVFRLCGQAEIGPSEEDQSCARMRPAISPPPWRKASASPPLSLLSAVTPDTPRPGLRARERMPGSTACVDGKPDSVQGCSEARAKRLFADAAGRRGPRGPLAFFVGDPPIVPGGRGWTAWGEIRMSAAAMLLHVSSGLIALAAASLVVLILADAAFAAWLFWYMLRRPATGSMGCSSLRRRASCCTLSFMARPGCPGCPIPWPTMSSACWGSWCSPRSL